VSGSFPSGRAVPAVVPQFGAQGTPSVNVDHAPISSQPLSDPEDGNWSDDEEDEEERPEPTNKRNIVDALQSSRGRTPTRSESGTVESNVPNESTTSSIPPLISSQQRSSTTKANGTRIVGTATDIDSKQAEGNPLIPSLGVSSAPGDRKRAVSSSSAFGSRARVKQHNTIRRRRPLSFQQAIESLLLDHSRDFRLDEQDARPFQRQQSSSLREGMTDVGVDTNGNNWLSGSLKADDMPESAMIVQQSSAPAEFSQPSTPSISIMTSPNIATQAPTLEAERKMMPPPIGVPSRSRVTDVEATKKKQENDYNKKKESKFFVAGQSIDDGASSVSGSLAPSQYSSHAGGLSPYQSPEQPQLRRAPSEAASDTSQRQHGRGHSLHSKSHHGLAVAGRNRSAVGLSRGGAAAVATGRGKGHGRVISAGRGLPTLTGPAKPQTEQMTVQAAQQASEPLPEQKKVVETKVKADKTDTPSRAPVKFIMGGEDDDDEDDFTDEDSDEEEEEEQRQRMKNSTKAADKRKPSEKGVKEEEEEDDEWSSASSTDSGEIRKRSIAQKKREEEERQQSMFQKVPIKSASTADVRNLGRRLSAPIDDRNEEQPPSPPVQPVRGLLSSLFHPETEPHPPPGQLAGRPHASAADLRMKPKRLSDSRSREQELEAKAGISVRRVPSSTQVPSMGGGGLKLSKSAVALPVLSTMGSRSESKRMSEVQGSRESAVFDDEESNGSDGEDNHPTSEALTRLNQLASQKKKQKKEGKHHSKKRSSNSSLNVEVAPEIDEEAMMADRSSLRESRNAAVPTPALSSHRNSASMNNIPEAGLPQTPRTTRRNMLRDELSESLRQNLLWERQSRNRMLGIGAVNNHNNNNNPRTSNMADSRSRSQVAPTSRNNSVLGGGALRPLTASNSATTINDQSQRRQDNNNNNNNHHHRHQHYTGDFHHAGW